ncbi:MAG: RNA-guided endonuclease InsQ/TnpB family protein [Ktedonobacteraceae bacterium]
MSIAGISAEETIDAEFTKTQEGLSLMKSYKFRLYPTKKQVETLEWTLDHCRDLYNAALDERKSAYRVTRKVPVAMWGSVATVNEAAARGLSISYHEQALQLPQIKEICPEYKQIHSQVLQDVLKRVDKGMKAFFRRVKNGEKAGYPRFQGENRYESFTYPQTGFSLENGKLVLSKIGPIKIKLHRETRGTIKTCTIKREGEHWYVTFSCEVEQVKCPPSTSLSIGIDMGLLHFATDSNGDTLENPRYFRKSRGHLKKLQVSLSRKKKSHRRRKAARLVAKAHRKIRNQRKDFHHKAARILVQTYETIVFEDLSIHHMVRRPKPKQDEHGKYLPNGAAAKGGLNKSIQDAGWASFIALVEHKAAWAGVTVSKVNPYKTSQMCSACHKEGEHKDLSIRTHVCIHCGVVLDRDHNAAINIRDRGLGRSLREPASQGTFREALA